MTTETSSADSARSPASAQPLPLPEKLRQLRDLLLTGLVERDVSVRLALLASLAGEHLLLIGPPGTAKSLIARRLRLAFKDASFFERLLTRFSVPEELFGPLSIRGLEEDRYERLTEGYVPTAHVAFLDEIFKANSAILNSLLTLLNERQFDNGVRRVKTPLIAVIGASNELPEGEELDALYDRFLLRLHVGPVSKVGFGALLGLRGNAEPVVPAHLQLDAEELAAVRAKADKVTVPEDVLSTLAGLRDHCTAEGILVSDRRWRKIVKLLQVAAFTNGRDAVSIWDCWLLQHSLWESPEQRESLYQWYADRVGATATMDPARLRRVVSALEAQEKADRESRSQARNSKGEPLFQDMDGKPTTARTVQGRMYRGKEELYLAPTTLSDRYRNSLSDRTDEGKGYTKAELQDVYLTVPRHGHISFRHWPEANAYMKDASNWMTKAVGATPHLEPTRHKPVYVLAQIQQTEDELAVVRDYRTKLDAHIAELNQKIESHLWVMADFAKTATNSLQGTRTEVTALERRLEKTRDGFARLPVEDPNARIAETEPPKPEATSPSAAKSKTPAKAATGRATRSKAKA